MNLCQATFNMNRRYIQINDLVIDQHDMLESASLTSPTKRSTVPYYARHGSHYFVPKAEILAAEQTLSMTLYLNVRKLGPQDRDLYKQYVLMNLQQHGRIFAVEGKKLIWTFALIDVRSEVYSTSPDEVAIDVDFTLPWGYWREADSRTIFFAPFDLCDWNAMFNLENNQFCEECKPCVCISEKEPCLWCIEKCDFLTIDNSLCVRGWEVLRTFIENCETRYRIIQNCEARNRLWSRIEDLFDHSFCESPSRSRMMADTFRGHTPLTTHHATLTLDGEFTNPIITFNSVKFQIEGHFIGRIIIRNNLTATFIPWEDCGCVKGEIPFKDIHLIDGFELYVRNGINTIRIDTGICNRMNCVRVNYRPITT